MKSCGAHIQQKRQLNLSLDNNIELKSSKYTYLKIIEILFFPDLKCPVFSSRFYY